jgi:hypothetical protein
MGGISYGPSDGSAPTQAPQDNGSGSGSGGDIQVGGAVSGVINGSSL